MSILNAIQNGQVKLLPSTADVNINLGNGHSNISVVAQSADIDTGCGNQNISAVVTKDLTVDTGFCGEDDIVALVGGDATITTREDNDTVNMYVGGNFTVDVGMVDPKCGAEEDNDKVTIVSTAKEGQNFLATGQGNDTVNLIASNVDLKKNTGELTLGFFGDNYNINSQASKNTIGFWGDDVTIKGVDGEHDIRTFDQIWANPDENINQRFATSFWQTDSSIVNSLTLCNGKEINFPNILELNIASYETQETNTTYETVKIGTETTKSEKITGSTSAEDLISKYKLDATQAAVLRSVDLSATLSDGSPKYSLVNIKRYGGGTNLGYFVVENSLDTKGNITGKIINSKGYDLTSSMQTQGYKISSTETLSTGEATKTTTYTTTDTYKTTATTITDTYKNYIFDGVKNLQVDLGDGKLTGHITARDGYINFNQGDAFNNCDVRDLIVTGGYVASDKISSVVTGIKECITKEVTEKSVSEQIKVAIGSIGLGGQTFGSPLVLDMNGDGKVSAESGKGVDINNDGKADGAATGGDKMLAMSDMNSNGKVDGTEVFGDKTVSPFSGKALNAKNGFEALKMIAQEAEARGFKCMSNGQVNVKALSVALASVGVKLGFISDDNVTQIQDLYGVSAIDISNYKEVQDTGSVQHNQRGVYTDENGIEYKVDDVWFEL